MSSAEVANGFYEAMGRGDVPTALGLIAPDCAWTEMDSFGDPGVYVGPDAVLENVFARIGAEWDGFALDVDRTLEQGDTAVGIGTYSGTCKATGKSFTARVVHVFRVRDGKIAAFEQFTDTGAIAAAKAS
jgi:ketosteroid isomerase-like protein